MGNLYNKREKLKLVPTKSRYPGLKSLIKARGLTYKALYLQYDVMRPDQFSNIVAGSIPETDGFLEVMLSALKVIGIETTEEELRRNPDEQIDI